MLLEMGQKAGFPSFRLNPHQNRHIMLERGAGEKNPQECWSVMTQAEKVLLLLLVLSLVLSVALSAFIIAHFLNESNCDTYKCIEASYKLLKTLDFATNPCEDFRQFTCGNYIKQEDQKEDLITADFENDDPALFKEFYQACTNATAIEDDHETTLATLLSQIGGWPLLMGNNWNENNFVNWQSFMVQVRRWGVKSDWLVSFDYHEDENGTNLLLIGPSKAHTSVNVTTAYYQEVIAQLAINLETTTPVEGQLNQMIMFGLNLSRISENARISLMESGDYSKIPVAKMNELWPENLLTEILNGLTRGYSVFTNSTVIVIASENYLYDLHKLLMAVPKRVQANYFVWKTVETFLPYSSDNIREVYSKYVELGDREDHCRSETVRRFHSAIEEEYVRKYKSEETLPLLNSTANLIYQSYNHSDDAKVDVVIEGPEGINSGVTNIKFTSNKIIRMITQIQFHLENEFYRCLHRKSGCIKESYYEDTQKLVTFFDTTDNTIHLPYNLVYSEYFMWNQPNYKNFANIGRLIGDSIIEAEEEKYNTSISKQGINLAYEGYSQYLQINGMEERLPVLNLTIKQLFWVHSSFMYCASENVSDKFEEVTFSSFFRKDFECS